MQLQYGIRRLMSERRVGEQMWVARILAFRMTFFFRTAAKKAAFCFEALLMTVSLQ